MGKTDENIKVYEQVIEQIRDMIIDGTLKKGDKLPTERDLASKMDISRSSVREAIRVMDVMGLVESRHGGGNYLRKSLENSLLEPLSMMFMLEECSPKDILELRRIIEVGNVSLAADRIDEEELSCIKDLVEKMKTTEDEVINAQFDRDFHYKIARASKNFLVISFISVISTLMDTFIKGARNIILSDESNRLILNRHHEDIYNALSVRDAKRAVFVMQKHFDLIEEYWKDM